MKKYIQKIMAILLLTTSLCLSSAGTTYALIYKEPTIPRASTLPGPISTEARKVLTQGVLPKVAVLFIGTSASLALLFLVIAGVRYATVYGNDEAAQTAKKQVIFALVGLFLSLMAYTIVAIVSNFNYQEDSPEVNNTSSPSTGTTQGLPTNTPTNPPPIQGDLPIENPLTPD